MSARLTRSVTIVPGKFDEGMAYLKQVTSYVAANHGINGWLGVQIGGSLGAIQWHVEFEDLGALEEAFGKTMADSGFRAIIKGAEGLFVEPPQDAIVVEI